MAKITKRSVDTLRAGGKDQYIWDEELSGFGLKVTPTGHKVYLVQYRLGGRKGRTRRATIGKHGVVSPDQARSKAQMLLRQVAHGEDPNETKDNRRSEQFMGELLDKFLINHSDSKLKIRSSHEYRRLTDTLVTKSLRRKPITEVMRADIQLLHNNLKDTPYQANRLLAVLSKFFNWCEKFGYRLDHSNPTFHVDKFREEKRKRYLSEVELVRLGEALTAQDEQEGSNPFTMAAIRLLVLTGARLNEILTLRWDWVDFDAQCLRLPDSKTGAKTVYLNPPAMKVLADTPRLENNPFVICGGKSGAHLINLQKPWRRIRRQAELDDVRLHDLRHSFASIAVASGMSLPLIGALLGHSQPQTTARYAHLSDDPLKKAVKTVGEHMKVISKPNRAAEVFG